MKAGLDAVKTAPIFERKTVWADAHKALAFDGFTLDLEREMLFEGRREVHLRPKAFELLVYLAGRSGVLTTQEEILEAVWPNLVIGKNSIAQCLSDIRRALGEEMGKKIRTIARKGVIFDIEVQALESKADRNEPPGSGFSYSSRRLLISLSILLVLALVFLVYASRTPSDDGPHHSARAKVDQYITIAEQLKDRRGPGDLERAAELYRKAVALDPQSEAALVGLASSLLLAGVANPQIPESDAMAIESALNRALALNPRSPLAHVRLGQYFWNLGDVEKARRHMSLAIRYGPEEPLVLSSAASRSFMTGDVLRGLELQERAIAVVPDKATYQANYAFMLFNAGRMEEAREAYLHAAALSPNTAERFLFPLARIAIILGDWEHAESLAIRLDDAVERDTVAALLSARTGRPGEQEAVERLQMVQTAEAAIGLAEWSALGGEAEQAYFWLDVAVERLSEEQRWQEAAERASYLRYSPFLRSLKGEQRWQQWLERVENLTVPVENVAALTLGET